MPWIVRHPVFDELRRSKHNCEIIYYAFDLLYLNDQDLRNEMLLTRKTTLASILPMSDSVRVRYTEHMIGEGEAMFHEMENRQLEGMVAKKIDSRYVSGRTKDWLKIKTVAGKESQVQRSEEWNA